MPEGENQIPESPGFHGSLDSRLINVYHTVRKTRVVQETMRHKESRWPVHGWVGLILIAVCWPLNWTLPGVRTAYLFFLLSAPVWWLFELINLRTANWEYIGRELFTPLQFNLLCTISFSVVIPAVFETAGVMRSFGWIERFVSGPCIPAT